jgi:hypothetical protein
MATRYDHLIINGGTDRQCTNTTWWGQSITPTSSYTASYITLMLKRPGAGTGTLTCSLYSATASPNFKPNAVLTTGTIAASTVGANYALMRFDLATPQLLTSGATYCIVLADSNGTDYIVWYDDTGNSGTDYGAAAAGACSLETANSGTSWSNFTSGDMLFEVWDNTSVDITGESDGVGQALATATYVIPITGESDALSATNSKPTYVLPITGTVSAVSLAYGDNSIIFITGLCVAQSSVSGILAVSLIPQFSYRRIVAIGTYNNGDGVLYYEEI